MTRTKLQYAKNFYKLVNVKPERAATSRMSHLPIDPLFACISSVVAVQTQNVATRTCELLLAHQCAVLLASWGIARKESSAQIGTSTNVQIMPTLEAARRRNAPCPMLTEQDRFERQLL